METLTWLLNILKVAVGLGFVIFIHELGHFLLAKWNGVKVEKFSIGFGRTLVGFRRGETEYVLAAVPLGGFVKMLGEGPEDQENKSTDPRAYPNKSVWARMAIISAGVIMNVLLGLACFVYAYGTGMTETPARVGMVVAGGPAYEAGVRPGDEIVAIDDRSDITFDHLILKVRLSGSGQVLHFDLKRPGQDKLVSVNIEPRREASADMPSIGIAPESSLSLAVPPFESPAGTVPPVKSAAALLKPDDTLVTLGPEGAPPVKLTDAREYHRLLQRWANEPLTFGFERRGGDSATTAKAAEPIALTLPPNRFVGFGIRLAMDPIASIQSGSPAERAGFRKGDRILTVDETSDFDPLRLPSMIAESAGQPMTFEVERPEPGRPHRTVSLTVTPDDVPAWTEPLRPYEPLEVPGLGLAYHIAAHIEDVAPDSPAAKAGLKKGDTINAMTFLPSAESKEKEKDKEKGASQLKPIEFKDESPNWAYAFYALQMLPRQAVQLTVNHANTPITITPEVEQPDWYNPLRGLQYQALVRKLPPQSARVALKRGSDDTVDNILGIYAMLRSLAQGRVSPKAMAGPLTIPQIAFASAASGWTYLIHFLGILSINLAVLNFLPIPPLDGGQMAFLIAEKVRGRPLPDSAVIVGSWMGLALVVALMVFVLYQDVARLLTG